MSELNKNVNDALNQQINKEMQSAYLYLSMANYFEMENLKGFAHWMNIQVQEELAHGMKLYKFVLDRGGKIEFMDIKASSQKWESPIQIFEAVLAHEKYITKSIEDLMALTKKGNDFATEGLLQWFIQEQIEEEANAGEILERLKQINGSPNGLFMYDNTLAGRQSSPSNSNE